jgi:hypothetical protein
MLRPYSCQLSVGAKHLEDKLSIIAKNSSPNASPVQLLVGAKHLEDKLSIIAKNSSPNASPVQLLLGRNIPPAPCLLFPVSCFLFPHLSLNRKLTHRKTDIF